VVVHAARVRSAAVAAACVPMLAKTSWPYYLLDPYVFAAIWWMGRPARVLDGRLAVPLLLAGGDIVLAAVEPTLPLPIGTGAVVGIAASTGMALAVALLFGLPGAAPRDAAAIPDSAVP